MDETIDPDLGERNDLALAPSDSLSDSSVGLSDTHRVDIARGSSTLDRPPLRYQLPDAQKSDSGRIKYKTTRIF